MFKFLESFKLGGDEAGYIHYMDGLYDLSDVLVYAVNRNISGYVRKSASRYVSEDNPTIATLWFGLYYRYVGGHGWDRAIHAKLIVDGVDFIAWPVLTRDGLRMSMRRTENSFATGRDVATTGNLPPTKS